MIRTGLATLAILLLTTASAAAQNVAGVADPGLPVTSEQHLWTEYFARRKAGLLDEALATAVELRDLTRSQHGPDSEAYGMALAEVGVSRLLLEDHDAAFADLRAAEAILQDELPLYSEKLVSALTFLGSALQQRGELEDALDAFTRAQHITHRLWGANNATQLPITRAKADTLQALGELHEAEEQHRLAWKLTRVAHGETSTEAIAAAARLGTWLRSIGEYDRAIRHFHEALVELQGDGPDRPEALPLLRGMAHAYRGGYRGKFARGMYERIADLMAAQPGAFSVDQRVELLVSFGDWLMQRYFERDAVGRYEAAWRIAAEAGPDGQHWIDSFAEPQLVRYGEMAPRDYSGAGQAVTFSFRVTHDGRIRSVGVVEATTGARDRARARKHFPELTRYRPAIIGGEAVGVREMTATMYLLPPGMALEPAPIAAPARLTSRQAVATASWTMLRGPEGMTLDVRDDDG